jgi:hypothetical protein
MHRIGAGGLTNHAERRVVMTKALFCCLTVAALPLIGCADSQGVGAPTAPSTLSSSSRSSAVSEPKASALSKGVTDLTLANAGWPCIQPGNGLVLCGTPGLGLPPIPPAADGQPTYNIMAFTLDHQFVHKVKLLRPDLYHGQPCQGGDAWVYVDFLNYYECIIPSGDE